MLSFAKCTLFLLCALLALAAGLLVPAHVRSVDQRVLEAAAAQGLQTGRTLELLGAEAHIGPARLLMRGTGFEAAPALEHRLAELERAHPEYAVTGGPEPYLENFLELTQFNPERAAPEGFLPYLVPETQRNSMADFLSTSTKSNVHALLSARTVHGMTRLRPAGSGAGAPYDAAVLSLALLVQGGYIGSELAAAMGDTATLAVAGELAAVRANEELALAVITLGRRLDFHQLAAVVSVCDTEAEIIDAARVVRNEPRHLAVYASAFLLSEDPSQVEYYLLGPGEDRYVDLKVAVALGEGAVTELLQRDLPIYRPHPWLAQVLGWIEPYRPAGIASLAWTSPSTALLIRFALFALAGLFASFILGVAWRTETVKVRLKRGNPIVMMRDVLTALTLAVVCWSIAEPAILRAVGDRTEPGVRLEFAVAGTFESLESPMKAMQDLNHVTLLVLALFFVLQLVIYALCLIRMREINKQTAASELKLKLLENEEHLFDFGLYVGLGGTVGSLILVAIGIVEASLMAAYASTLFGILFVALLKIFHVRPFRRKLILLANSESTQPRGRSIPAPDDLMKDAVL